MTDLIERLERATGPDRKLDARIHGIVNNVEIHMKFSVEGDCLYWDAAFGKMAQVPAYTGSFDAVLKLMPDGWMWDVSSSGCAWIMRDDDIGCDSQIVISGIGNPIIALCIVALKAREAAK